MGLPYLLLYLRQNSNQQQRSLQPRTTWMQGQVPAHLHKWSIAHGSNVCTPSAYTPNSCSVPDCDSKASPYMQSAQCGSLSDACFAPVHACFQVLNSIKAGSQLILQGLQVCKGQGPGIPAGCPALSICPRLPSLALQQQSAAQGHEDVLLWTRVGYCRPDSCGQSCPQFQSCVGSPPTLQL